MKPSIPKGTRDFGPVEMQRRNHIFSIIKTNFELFGFLPIETPAMENITTLTGKYGEEGDQLIFKILNSRIHEHKDKELLKKEFDLSLEQARNSEHLTERALRYDLTVPFARYVAMNHQHLTYPFKRYQIQPVWRADKPQKGRYREFYQCDADIIGSNSLINELELIGLMDKSFSELTIPVIIKFNNRKILSGIAEKINEKEKIIDITVAIDKLDKIGKEGVVKELQGKNISSEAIDQLSPLFDLEGTNEEKLNKLKTFLENSDVGLKGISEIEYLLNGLKHLSITHTKIELDITLARGLNYYTGTIFEVKANAGSLTSSILGGGRYDDLTSIFGLKNVSGVGISFGIDRIYDVMHELNLFENMPTNQSSTKVIFANNFGSEEEAHCLGLIQKLRASGINAELYPDQTKLKKQFEYAEKKGISYICIVGSEEIMNKEYSLKNISSGAQEKLSIEKIIEKLSPKIN